MGFTTTQDLTIKNFSLNLSPLPSFLMHGGDIATIIQKNDWSQTNLGPIKSWPNSLKTVLGMILENKLGMYIAWGLEFTQLYNESFKSVLGEVKYSVGIGNTANKTFSESWDILGPLFNQVMKGESIAQIDYLVKLERDGHIEDCYFTFSYSPIRVDSGQVGGVLVTTIETTARVKSDLAIKASMADALRAEAILQEVLSQAPLGIAILQGPNHVFTLTNPYYLKTLFKNERKLLGKAARDAVPEIAGQGFLELLDTVYRTGKSYVGNETSMKIIQHDGLAKRG